MDPLSVLKDFNTSSKLQLVKLAEGNVQFGDRYSFPATTPVYKAAGQATAYYSLQDVLFYLKNRQLKPQEYVMAASQAGVGSISIMDRKKVLDVLDGLAALDPGLVPVGVVALAGARGEAAEPAAKRQRVAGDDPAAQRGGREQERQLRSRNSMLLAPNKEFRKVLEVVLEVKKQVHKQGSAAAAAAAAAAKSAAKHAPPPAKGSSQPATQGHTSSSSRYGRDATADQLKAMAPGTGGALAVNMYGATGKAAPPPPPPVQGAAGYVPIRKSGSSAPAPAPGSGSGSKPHASAHGSKPGSAPPPGSKPGSKPGAPPGKGDAKKGGVPIIIVPSGLTSMINMYNARSFLEEGLFVPSAQAQAAAGGAPKPSSATFHRTAHRSSPVEYVVTDKAPAPNSPDWERVVAVIVQGAKWQFKDWPHKGAKEGDLVDALAKVCGFYVHYADEKVGQPVSDWNVRTIPLHRETRHKDMTSMLGLYRHLDTFLQSKRSTLTY
ncbi:hypothetical protein HYH03_018579 [Edaphochlamys debaryana]|uniref:Uncharacterized protein n=1 Tax=Edaphochlamys debaryana TaxID=47281 RepID=A0A836BN54_9CHLO|nr:hypothetical protein HYH03_018579 [Edaphochlamys debaryana]|eukprot:KAG2482472.1 hypothetical protein HYH03_018579 [Edaphochlamys debaryana]